MSVAEINSEPYMWHQSQEDKLVTQHYTDNIQPFYPGVLSSLFLPEVMPYLEISLFCYNFSW